MSDKQLGAAPKPQAEAEQASGWFTRLRAQPGFRTATVAFVLTVILGIGGPAAYAYWSQSSSGTITGTIAAPVLPKPSALRCTTATPNRIEWTKVRGADPGAVYILTFTLPKIGKEVTYAVNMGAQVNSRGDHYVEPTNLGGLFRTFGGAGSWINPADLTVTVRSGLVTVPVGTVPVEIKNTDVLAPPGPSEVLNMGYYSAGVLGNFPC